jgi:tetratricopeptide (TPR) repeat protein
MFINCGYVLKLRDEASHHDVLELFDSVVERLSFLRAEESDHAERSEKQGLDLQESSFFDRLELVVPHEASCYSYVKHQLALLDESRGFVDKAVEGLRAAVQLNPNYSYAHFDLGRALLEQRNYQEAVQALSRSVELDPNYSFAQFDLGRVLMEQGNYEAAEQALSRSIELDPNYSFAQFDLGRALMRLGNHRKAERVLRRSIELNPAFAPARLEYVTACAKMGKMRPAIAAFVASCRIDPDLSADYLVREMEGLAQRLLANTWGSLKKLSLFVMASTVVSRLIRYLIRCGVKVRPR